MASIRALIKACAELRQKIEMPVRCHQTTCLLSCGSIVLLLTMMLRRNGAVFWQGRKNRLNVDIQELKANDSHMHTTKCFARSRRPLPHTPTRIGDKGLCVSEQIW